MPHILFNMQEYNEGPSVSVVVPVYNTAPYVERCLQSVMSQTYSAAECIIVDDASPDDSIIRCQRLIEGYSGPTRFIILHHSSNQGASAARNTGIDAASSSHIYFMDSDDEMTPDCLEKLVAPIMRDNGIEMVMGNMRKDQYAVSGLLKKLKQRLKNRIEAIASRNSQKEDCLELRDNEEIYRWYYCGRRKRTISMTNKLLRLSFVKENNLYNRKGILMEDALWNFYLYRSLNHAVIIPDITYLYHQHPNSVTTGTSSEKKRMCRGHIYREMAENIVSGERIEEIDNKIVKFCYNYIDAADNPDYQYAYEAFLRYLSDGKHKKSVRQLKRAHQMAKSHIGRKLGRLEYKQWKRLGLAKKIINTIPLGKKNK